MKVFPLTTFLALSFAFSLTSLKAQASYPTPFLIVSDVDDTVKITHVSKYIPLVYNGIWGEKTFLGMSSLYTELSLNSTKALSSQKPLVFLSGSPRSLGNRIETMLTQRGFPAHELLLKATLFTNTATHKTENLNRMASQTRTPMILIGDDTEKDPETLSDFAHAHPEQTLVVYIHKVLGHPVPDGIIEYMSAFEIALHEVEAGRLSPEQAIRVGEVLLAEHDPQNIFPEFALCPINQTELAIESVPSKDHSSSALDEFKEKVAQHLVHLCLETPRGRRRLHRSWNADPTSVSILKTEEALPIVLSPSTP